MENLSDCHLDQHRRIAGLSQRKQYWLLYSPDLLQPRLMCLSQQLSQQMYPAYRIGGGLLLELQFPRHVLLPYFPLAK